MHSNAQNQCGLMNSIANVFSGSWIGASLALLSLAVVAQANNSNPLPSVTVTGESHSLHDVSSESERVGPANQPEWTTRRAFAETDIYVIPPGEIEFNQFYISSHPREGKSEHSFESEFEFGLPWRTQFDVELNYLVNDGHLEYDSTLIELPHALADWGAIPLNPTPDIGWRFNNDEADAYFFRLLLAEEFGSRWHFGANLSYERQTGGEQEEAYELNTALSYVIKDSKLTVGAEFLIEYETAIEDEGEGPERVHATMAMLGPSLLYKPTRDTHLGLVTLFGLTHDAPIVEAYFSFGIDFELFGGRYGSGKGDSGSKLIRRPR